MKSSFCITCQGVYCDGRVLWAHCPAGCALSCHLDGAVRLVMGEPYTRTPWSLSDHQLHCRPALQ